MYLVIVHYTDDTSELGIVCALHFMTSDAEWTWVCRLRYVCVNGLFVAIMTDTVDVKCHSLFYFLINHLTFIMHYNYYSQLACGLCLS